MGKTLIFVKVFGIFLKHGSIYALKRIIKVCLNFHLNTTCKLPWIHTYNFNPTHHIISILLISELVNAVSTQFFSFHPSRPSRREQHFTMEIMVERKKKKIINQSSSIYCLFHSFGIIFCHLIFDNILCFLALPHK